MSGTAEITINDHEYRIGRMTPKQQLHVARRLLPMFEQALSRSDEDSTLNATVMSYLGGLSDAEFDDIVDPCLMVVTRKTGNDVWVQVMPKKGQLMFQDMTATEILRLTFAVIESNLSDFFQGSPTQT